MPPISRSHPLWLVPLLACLAAGARADSGAGVDYKRLGWETRDDISRLPASLQPHIEPMCTGAWITPVPLGVKPSRSDSTPIRITASTAHYDPGGQSVLSGNVVVRQGTREVEADNAELYQQSSSGTFSGNIMVTEPGMVLTGEQAFIDFGKGETRLQRAEFVSALINAHGRADQITRNDKGVITIGRGEYSTCEPTHRSWYFVARNIALNPARHEGVVHDATLRVDGVPVFYTPYFNFPLDDTRKSGILIPRFGSTSDGGFDLAVPVYLNLAPNYDATVTPRYISRRGDMAEGEFRYLLPLGGSGILEGADLPRDPQFDHLDRKMLSWQHGGDISPTLALRTNINYVSDNAYFTDLGSSFTTANTTVVERTGQINYHRDAASLQLRLQSFQTIDPTLTDYEKPYASLPDIQLKLGGATPAGWQPGLMSELTDFRRTITDGSGPEINGGRLRLQPSLGYAFNRPWGYVHPAAKLNYLAYDLRGSGVAAGAGQPAVTVPTFSLDTGLEFERNAGHYLQTFEPRAFYLLAPYHDQGQLPVFDTSISSFAYSQLFRDSRFSGGDRIDDANQLSLGATSRFIDPADGSEQFHASLGEIFYLRDRRVTVPSTVPGTSSTVATSTLSGLAGEAAAQFSEGWSGTVDAVQAPSSVRLDEFSLAVTYMPPERGSLWNLSYVERHQDSTLAQQAMRQAQLSTIQPLGINWKLIGLYQYDFLQQHSENMLAGVEYDACCWSVRLVRRQYLTAPTTLSGGSEVGHTAYFMEIRLKGLAGLGSSIDSLLGSDMFGYSQLLRHNSNPLTPQEETH